MLDALMSRPVVPVRIAKPGTIEAPPGLEGVIVADTEVGDVRGDEGFYHYREYDAVELADRRSLEDVWHLLFQGHLPSGAERASFAEEIGRAAVLPPAVQDILPAIAAGSVNVMDGV